MSFNRSKYAYLIGFCLILSLTLLNLPPWFTPTDWGKTIAFRIILSVLIFLFLWQFILNKDRQKNPEISEKLSFLFSKKNLVFWLLISLLAINLLATVFSLDPNYSLWGNPYRSGGFMNFAFYIIFAILAFLILKEKGWKKIWDFAIFIGILVSFIAIVQWQGWFSDIFISYTIRPPASLGNPIMLAIYLLLLSFLTLSFGIKENKSAKKIFYFSALFLFIFAIFLTYSRAAYLGLFLGFLWFLFFLPKKITTIKISAAIFLILALFGFYFVNTCSQLPEFIQENKTLKGAINRLSMEKALQTPRISGWKISWQALKDKPILGFGPENFAVGFDKHYDPSLPKIETAPHGITSWWDRAHNFIFDIGITAGLPALTIYLLLFAVLLKQLQKLKKKNPEKALICHGIQATFIGYLTANIFSFDAFSSYLISFLLIGFSLHLIYSAKETSLKGLYPTIAKWRKPLLALLLIVLIWFAWSFNLKPLQINKEINLAEKLVKSKRCDLALEKMEKALSKKSFLGAYLRVEYVDMLEKCGEQAPELKLEFVKRSAFLMKEAVEIQPYHSSHYAVLGSLLNFWMENETNAEIFQNLKTEAEYSFATAHKLSPKRQEFLVEWAKNNLITGQYDKAKEKAEECVNLNEKMKDCWWILALSNAFLNEEEEFEKNIATAKKLGYPVNSENSLLTLTATYAKNENYRKLMEIYQQLIKIKPKNPDYHASLAIVYRELGDFENAGKSIQKALELSPALKEAVEEFLKTLR